jgi:hypothetical protein
LNIAGHNVISAITPDAAPVAVGWEWSDTVNHFVRMCTSTSPYTFVTIGSPSGGGPSPSSVTPIVVNGAAAAIGTSVDYARADHKHDIPTITLTGQSAPSTPVAGDETLYAVTIQGHTQLSVIDENGNILRINRDQVLIIQNKSGLTLTKGQLVRVSGSTGNTPTVTLADADVVSPVPGVAGGFMLETLANNAFGLMQIGGQISGLDTSAFAEGAVLYVSQTAGAFTDTPPVSPAFRQAVGIVTKSNVAIGSVEISISGPVPTAATTVTTLDGVGVVGTTTNYAREGHAHAIGTLIDLTVTNTITGSISGNAGTATKLATARAINGVNFDGTAAITVTAAAGTLSGTTLAAGVIASSLTSVGTLAALTVTATITGSISGNAGTATTLQTARAINGVNFDGSAAITVTAAAGTLTGTVLNATVVTSSLTAVGTIVTGVWNGTTIAVANGGTGLITSTTYALFAGGTMATGAHQQVSGVGTAGQILESAGAGALPTWVSPTISVVNPGNPAATTSTSAVMMGLAAAFTPTQSGRLMIWVVMTATNNTLLDGILVQLKSGTGTAPANGDAATGTNRGSSKSFTAPVAGSVTELVIIAAIAGLTLNTALWFDLAVNAVTGGTATVSSISLMFHEI